MDLSSLLGTVLSANSVNSLSQNANVSAGDVQSILSAAMPSLLSGALSQANDSSTASGFANALSQHSAADTSDLSSFLSGVDTDDGAKIVDHLLGSDSKTVINQIAKQSGVKAADVKKVLSAAAPLLMSLLGKETAQQQSSNSALGVASIMGSLLGGGNSTASLLAGLLGGGSQQQSSPGSGLLGGLMGLLK